MCSPHHRLVFLLGAHSVVPGTQVTSRALQYFLGGDAGDVEGECVGEGGHGGAGTAAMVRLVQQWMGKVARIVNNCCLERCG